MANLSAEDLDKDYRLHLDAGHDHPVNGLHRPGWPISVPRTPLSSICMQPMGFAYGAITAAQYIETGMYRYRFGHWAEILVSST